MPSRKTNYVTEFTKFYNIYESRGPNSVYVSGVTHECTDGNWTRISVGSCDNSSGYSAFICNNSNPDKTILDEQKQYVPPDAYTQNKYNNEINGINEPMYKTLTLHVCPKK